jgi:electron transfer flavoprotein alpha subunit
MKTAIVINPAETEEVLRELIGAARKAGSGCIELWWFGAEGQIPAQAPVEEVLFLIGGNSALADSFVPVLLQLVEKQKPELILFGPGVLAKDLCVALAALLKGSCALGITDMEKSPDGLRITRRVFGLQLEAAFEYSQAPYLFSVSKDSFIPAEDTGEPKLSRTEVFPAAAAWYEDYTEITEEKQAGLETCSLIFAGGRGLGSKAGMESLAELGLRMKAGVGATRPAALNGWLPLSRMIGLSGLVVKPSLCVAFGISGCAPFIKGVEKSECIIAINQDPDAAIFRHSDVGLIADCNAVVKALLERTAVPKQG